VELSGQYHDTLWSGLSHSDSDLEVEQTMIFFPKMFPDIFEHVCNTMP
jgi:hypothetical protein